MDDLSCFTRATRDMRQPYALVRADGEILACNAAAERLIGAELTGRTLPSLGHNPDAIARILKLAVRTSQPLPGMLEHANGDFRYEANRTRFDGTTDGPYLIVHFHRREDSNWPFIALNRKIERLNQELRNRAEVAEQQARALTLEREARLQAEEVNRIKDEFLASVSHELRTPLQAIGGWASILQHQRNNASMLKQGLKVIARNVEAQNKLIEDLIDLSQALGGNLSLYPETICLRSLIESVVATMTPAIEAKEHTLTVDVRLHPAHIRVDPDRIRQVVWNLVSNACKYTPRNGAIHVTLEQRGAHVELRVSDNGDGIAPEFMPYVFDRFRQADASTERREGGLGLGLSIVRYIVEMHGGLVWGESDGIGEGSTFVVTLPAGLLDDGPAAQSLDGSDEEIEPILSGLHILLVEDHDDSRAMLREVLGLHGARVTAAASAPEARAHFAQPLPDMILSDIEMPGEDGFALIRALRARERSNAWPATPAVALTAYNFTSAERRAVEAGFQCAIPKPLKLPALLELIRDLCGRR